MKRTRLRGKLDDEGVPDRNADRRANEILQRENTATPPGAFDDRAAGPYGERGGGGDPGAVIELRSPAFNDHTTIPPRFSRDGGNVSPPLEWSGVPEGTAELALVCEDPDAPGGVFLHWLVTGIDPATTGLAEGEEPSGRNWPNGYGQTGYGGPRPPVGDDAHRYVFRLYALGDPSEIPSDASTEEVRAALDDQRLATGTLTGLFAR